MKTRTNTDDLKARPVDSRKPGSRDGRAGFTLFEVLVALVVLAVGAAVTMSVISGSLRNIRKAQIRTHVIGYAQTAMEAALHSEDMQQPITYEEVLEDGFRFVVQVDEYETDIDLDPEIQSRAQLPIRLLQYTVAMIGPDSPEPVYQLQTLKIVNTSQESQQAVNR